MAALVWNQYWVDRAFAAMRWVCESFLKKRRVCFFKNSKNSSFVQAWNLLCLSAWVKIQFFGVWIMTGPFTGGIKRASAKIHTQWTGAVIANSIYQAYSMKRKNKAFAKLPAKSSARNVTNSTLPRQTGKSCGWKSADYRSEGIQRTASIVPYIYDQAVRVLQGCEGLKKPDSTFFVKLEK